MNIKKHLPFFITTLSLVVIANLVGIIIGIINGNFNALFIISLITFLLSILVFLYFVKAQTKREFMKVDCAKYIEYKKISLLISGIALGLFLISVILSFL